MEADDVVQAHLKHAYSLALNSPDPSTQNGALIVHRDGEVSVGYNTFPVGVKSSPERLERPLKYMVIEHAERMAIFHAARQGRSTKDAIMYVCWYACADCARAIIESGIDTVIGHKAMYDATPEHWKESVEVGLGMLKEAGVEYYFWDGPVPVSHSIRFNGAEFTP